MARRTDILDLGRLGLSSGEGRRLDLEVGIDPLELGGQRYLAGSPAVRLDVSRTGGGYSLRLRCEVRLEGPCMRCLSTAEGSVSLDAWEVEQAGGGEELDSPYVEGDDLRLGDWTRDALVLALPAQVLCRESCLGLCAECGADLNEAGPGHGHERARDPRWAKLGELRFE